MTIKAMHDRHKLNKAMAKFREGLSEMAAVDPNNPENGSVGIAVKDLEESVDYWLEEVDRVPEVHFDAGPWMHDKVNEAIVARDSEGTQFTVAREVETHNGTLLAAAPDLVYASYGLWRKLEADPGVKREILKDMAQALNRAGINVPI